MGPDSHRQDNHLTLTRRHLLFATASTVAINFFAPVHALTQDPASIKAGRTVINAGGSGLAFINLAHRFTLSCTTENFPSLLSSDGYPKGLLKNPITWGNNVCDPTYYGRYLIWWLGTGCLQLNPQTIVYRGGKAVVNVGPSELGSVAFNFAIGAPPRLQPTSSAPVEFAFGCLIASASTANGLVQFTTSLPNALNNISTGARYKFNNLSGLPAGPNSDGSWTIIKINNNTMTLQGSSAHAGLVSVIGTGGPGTQTEAILSNEGITWNFLGGVTYSGFGGLVWIKKADLAAFGSGQLASPEYVRISKDLNPRFVRFMDYSAVQGDRSSSYAHRSVPTHLSWGVTNYIPEYYAGTITNTGANGNFSDVFVSDNPVASGAGSYTEGEVVAGQIGTSSANIGLMAALNVNSRGPAPIFNSYGSMLSLTMTGSVPAAGSSNLVYLYWWRPRLPVYI